MQENSNSSASKKIKVDIMPLVPMDDAEPIIPILPVKLPELIELSETFIAERLSLEIATELVMDSMVHLYQI